MKNLKDLANDLKRHQKELKEFINRKAPRLIANKAVEIFMQSWDKEGFTNATGGFEAWQKRKENAGKKSDSRGTLIGKGSGKLRRSLRVIGSPNLSKIVIGTAVPYAKIHNEGGTLNIPITEAMRGFFWVKYYEEIGKRKAAIGNLTKRYKKGKMSQNRYTTIVGEKKRATASAQKWKNLALTKKQTLTINMPKRQFMGNSMLLTNAIKSIIDTGLDSILNK